MNVKYDTEGARGLSEKRFYLRGDYVREGTTDHHGH
jgi:hypothetical protein